MAVPARRTSKMRKNTRRSHHALTVSPIINCSNCGAIARPHRACSKCNTYKGLSILNKKASSVKVKTAPVTETK